MNSHDLFTRLRDSLKTLNYEGTTQPIFGEDGVKVVDELPTLQITSWRSPSCWIVDGGGKPYLQNPTVFEQFITVIIVVEHHGSKYGERLMLGSNEEPTTKSGRGLLKIESDVINHVHNLISLSGSKVTFSVIKRNPVKKIQGSSMVKKPLMFSALVDLSADNSQGNEDNILRMPGKIYMNPVNLTDDFGTLLGYKNQEIMFEADMENAIRNVPGDETTGREFGRAMFLGANPYIIFTMLEYSSGSMKLCFPSMEDSGDVKGYNTKTGKNFAASTDTSFRFLFVPDDTANNKILLLQKVVPKIVKPLGISRNGNTEYAVKLQCYRKTTDNDGMYFLGDISNATLR